ncbi:Endopolygalacturonase 1 like protein [Verticillium longisporum]|uniref:endo-polygalacturonase n=1 Tax=Verticillium longisporum TaxID=100787 RepID=A0A8I2Z206_VERLO|nr:Endopolygalacturonase 1 like protein [Verticillium longisporum]KAG7122630.1 Endopolygalacturonase 1 like protein [Verticillium longisporum]
MLTNVILALGALASTAAANPLPAKFEVIESRATACTFTNTADLAKSKKTCDSITLNNIAVPAGTTLDLSSLKSGAHVVFQGKTTFGYEEWEGPLIQISGEKITVEGASGHIIDADGARWWDGKGGNGGKTKPKLLAVKGLNNSIVKGLNFKDQPVHGISVNTVNNLQLIDVTLDASAGDSKGGHNTDGFDVGNAQNILISGAIVKNQDDCLAINSGTNITFTGGNCSGGHGLSIGSVGNRSNNVVKTIRINNSKISNSDNGVRIKTISGATGSVSDVIYDTITLSNIAKNGIVIEQDYENGSPTGTPTAGVPITDLTINKVVGTVASKGTNVYILCAKGACSNWKWSGVNVTGGGKPKSCQNVPSPATCS